MTAQKLSNKGKSPITLIIFTVISLITLPAQAALLISSGGDNSIKQYDETTGAYIRDFVTSGSGGLSNPQGLTFGSNGNLYVSSSDTNSVKEYNGTTGEYIGDFVSSSSGLLTPQGLSFTDDGSLFVTSQRIPDADAGQGVENTLSSGLLQYNGATGEFLGSIATVISGLAAGSIPIPQDVVFGGPDSTLFVGRGIFRRNSGSISEYEPITGTAIERDYTFSEIKVSSPIDPNGLAISDNFLFYTDSSAVGRYDLINREIDELFVDIDSGGLNEAVDVAIGANGNLFVSSSGNNSVKQYDGQTGDFLGDFIVSGSGGLSSPTYLITANVPVPEPSSVLGIVAMGGLFVGSALQRQRNNRKKQPLN